MEGETLRPECKARRCFYKDAYRCQGDQGWHSIKNGFPQPCDCDCHKELENKGKAMSNNEANSPLASPELDSERQVVSADPAFTPGPWRIEPIFGDDDLSIVLDYDIPNAGRPIMIAHVVEEDDHGFAPATKAEGVANARLIAAAPALYEACAAIARWDAAEKTPSPYDADGGRAFRERIRLCDEAMKKAAAALALADTGKGE